MQAETMKVFAVPSEDHPRRALRQGRPGRGGRQETTSRPQEASKRQPRQQTTRRPPEDQQRGPALDHQETHGSSKRPRGHCQHAFSQVPPHGGPRSECFPPSICRIQEDSGAQRECYPPSTGGSWTRAKLLPTSAGACRSTTLKTSPLSLPEGRHASPPSAAAIQSLRSPEVARVMFFAANPRPWAWARRRIFCK